jgi:hypothetical protein
LNARGVNSAVTLPMLAAEMQIPHSVRDDSSWVRASG